MLAHRWGQWEAEHATQIPTYPHRWARSLGRRAPFTPNTAAAMAEVDDDVTHFYGGGEAADADAERPAAKKAKKAAGFDYTSDKRYEKLVGVFNAVSLKELSALRIEDLRKKAAELSMQKKGVMRAQGYFRSYQNAIDTILELADLTYPHFSH